MAATMKPIKQMLIGDVHNSPNAETESLTLDYCNGDSKSGHHHESSRTPSPPVRPPPPPSNPPPPLSSSDRKRGAPSSETQKDEKEEVEDKGDEADGEPEEEDDNHRHMYGSMDDENYYYDDPYVYSDDSESLTGDAYFHPRHGDPALMNPGIGGVPPNPHNQYYPLPPYLNLHPQQKFIGIPRNGQDAAGLSEEDPIQSGSFTSAVSYGSLQFSTYSAMSERSMSPFKIPEDSPVVSTREEEDWGFMMPHQNSFQRRFSNENEVSQASLYSSPDPQALKRLQQSQQLQQFQQQISQPQQQPHSLVNIHTQYNTRRERKRQRRLMNQYTQSAARRQQLWVANRQREMAQQCERDVAKVRGEIQDLQTCQNPIFSILFWMQFFIVFACAVIFGTNIGVKKLPPAHQKSQTHPSLLDQFMLRRRHLQHEFFDMSTKQRRTEQTEVQISLIPLSSKTTTSETGTTTTTTETTSQVVPMSNSSQTTSSSSSTSAPPPTTSEKHSPSSPSKSTSSQSSLKQATDLIVNNHSTINAHNETSSSKSNNDDALTLIEDKHNSTDNDHTHTETGTTKITSGTGTASSSSTSTPAVTDAASSAVDAIHSISTAFIIDYPNAISLVIISGFYACVISYISFGFMLIISRGIIQVILIFSVILALAWGTIGITTTDPYGIISMLGFTALFITLGYTIYSWRRVPFATTNLYTALCAMRCTVDITLLGMLTILVAFGWCILWSMAFIGVINTMSDVSSTSPSAFFYIAKTNIHDEIANTTTNYTYSEVTTTTMDNSIHKRDNNATVFSSHDHQNVDDYSTNTMTVSSSPLSSSSSSFIYFEFLVYAFFFISFYWTNTVIKNVVRVTVASAIGTWWFHPNEIGPCCSISVSRPLLRSFTVSLGTIAFGSLVTLPAQTMSYIGQWCLSVIILSGCGNCIGCCSSSTNTDEDTGCNGCCGVCGCSGCNSSCCREGLCFNNDGSGDGVQKHTTSATESTNGKTEKNRATSGDIKANGTSAANAAQSQPKHPQQQQQRQLDNFGANERWKLRNNNGSATPVTNDENNDEENVNENLLLLCCNNASDNSHINDVHNNNRLLEKWFRGFRCCNRWAFTYVGMYGYNFSEGGEKAMQLFETREWVEFVNDNLIQNVLLMASIVIGGSCGCFAVIVEEVDGFEFTNFYKPIVTAFLTGSILGFVLSNILLLGVVGSAVNTVLVCFAAGPFEFDKNHPILSREMREAWSQHIWEA